jgi:ubiquinone biosynthesis monooxygenase Coq7
MHADEAAHADKAVELGAAHLPWPVRQAMRGMAGVMTRLSYHV